MAQNSFHTSMGQSVTAVSADGMRDVDRVAVEDVEVQLLQMVENAGRDHVAVNILTTDGRTRSSRYSRSSRFVRLRCRVEPL